MTAIERYYSLVKETLSGNSMALNIREKFQEYLCLGLEVLVSSTIDPLSDEIVSALVALVIDVFKSRKETFDEGYMLLSALC